MDGLGICERGAVRCGFMCQTDRAKQYYRRAVSCWESMGGSEVNQDNEEVRGRQGVKLTSGES